jgi:hypothetical protein
MIEERWRMADGGWRMTDGGWQMTDGIADDGSLDAAIPRIRHHP